MDQFLVRYKRLLAEHASDEPSTSGLNSVAINRKELASPASEHEAHHVEERDSHELLSHGTAEDCSNSSEQMNSCTPVSGFPSQLCVIETALSFNSSVSELIYA
ncbi:hypothetical protein AB6A40_002455 [Gnathostoma spinigerum]|uniref:Uncharacterized protein n=1 Tax=Gnathostoma spinigerum TaxID=75299 RepID=A0ABD6EEC8_9BILA